MSQLFIYSLFVSPIHFFMVLFSVTFSVCLHEYCHARVAYFFGDTTAANAGHLTLNPLRQMGLYSIIMMIFLGICWGQVPVNPYVLRQRSKWAYPLSCFAGPAANLLLFFLAIAGFIGFSFFGETPVTGAAIALLFILGTYNFVLFVFNMLPIPGLDGWNILSYFCPKINNVNSEFAKGAMLLLIFLAFFLVGSLFSVGSVIILSITEFVIETVTSILSAS